MKTVGFYVRGAIFIVLFNASWMAIEAAEVKEVYRAADQGSWAEYRPEFSALNSSGTLFFSIAGGAIMRISTDGVLDEFVPNIKIGNFSLTRRQFLVIDGADNLYVGGILESESAASYLAFFRITSYGEIIELARFDTGTAPIDSQEISAAAVDQNGNLYISGYVSSNIIRITSNGVVTEFLRGPLLAGDIPFESPSDLLFDSDDNLYIAATNSDNIIRLSSSGELTEIVNGENEFDGGHFSAPHRLSINQYNELFVSSAEHTNGGAYLIRTDGQISKPVTYTGDGTGFVLDFGLSVRNPRIAFLGEALIGSSQTAVDSEGNFYLIGWLTNNIFRISRDGSVVAIAGTTKGTSSLIRNPISVVVDRENTLYVNSGGTRSILKIENSLPDIDEESICSRAVEIESVSNTFNCISTHSSHPVFRFYNFRDNAFFYTSSWDEAAILKTNSDSAIPDQSRWPYVYQGSTFASATSYPGSVPLYRFFNYQTGHHFFTASEEEKNYVQEMIEQVGWPFIFEGVAFQVYSTDPTPEFDGRELPVFRFYSVTMNRHFYTANTIEATLLNSSEEWGYEGIGFYGEAH